MMKMTNPLALQVLYVQLLGTTAGICAGQVSYTAIQDMVCKSASLMLDYVRPENSGGSGQ